MPTTDASHLDRRETEVAGVRITDPDRTVFPSLGITKEAVARYYEDISPWMLPHIRGRPLTLVRAPAGAEAPVALTRHTHGFGPSMTSHLRLIHVRDRAKTDACLIADSPEGLVALAQLDVLEVHTWNACGDRVETPDRLVFDLDPGPGVPWIRVVEAAHAIRGLLARLGLASFPKTTGGRGLHLVIPLAPRSGWDECLGFARAVAARFAEADPRRFTSSMVRSARVGRIYIDSLRNHRTASSIAEYSPRALRNAPVAAPIAWDEVCSEVPSDSYSIRNALQRVRERRADPWTGYEQAKQQRLRGAMLRTLSTLTVSKRL